MVWVVLVGFFKENTIPALFITSVVMSFLTSLIYRVFGNYNEMRRIKAELSELKESMDKARKNKDEKKLLELMKRQNELAMEQFQYMFKPMFLTMLVVGVVFYFLKQIFHEVDFSANLPFYIPIAGEDVGWLGFYIITSMPLTVFFRKLMKLD